MLDDLCFDDYGSLDPMAPQLIEECNAAPPCAHCTAEAKRTARAVELWGELARQRHAREASVDDKRTTDLALLLNIANRLTELSNDTTNLALHDDDGETLKLLRYRLARAERAAKRVVERARRKAKKKGDSVRELLADIGNI